MKILFLALALSLPFQAHAAEWQPVPEAQALQIFSRLNDLLKDFRNASSNCDLTSGFQTLFIRRKGQNDSHFTERVIEIFPNSLSLGAVRYFRRAGQPVLLVRSTESAIVVKELLVSTDASQRTIVQLQYRMRELVSTTDGPLTNPVRRERWETRIDLACY